MPSAPRKACACPACTYCNGHCPELTTSGRCPSCMTVYNRQSRNPETAAFYATSRWKHLARRVRREQPWCNTPGCTNLTTQADHIIPLETVLANGDNPYARQNLQGLCLTCHGRKSRLEHQIPEAQR